MNKDVQITIQGLQIMENEENESVKTNAKGTYYEKGGSHYVLYDEPFDEYGNPIRSRIKFNDSERRLQMHKSGPVETDMLFEIGRRNISNYKTPYGTMHIGVKATGMEFNKEADRMVIVVDYEMDVDGEYLADCNININIESQ
jgi:uncharacterized beta-barrel protein YwiB (DUF1934 family)